MRALALKAAIVLGLSFAWWHVASSELSPAFKTRTRPKKSADEPTAPAVETVPAARFGRESRSLVPKDAAPDGI